MCISKIRALSVVLLGAVMAAAAQGCGGASSDGSGGSSSTGSSSSGSVDTTHFCDQWAIVCPQDATPAEVATCKINCEQNQMMHTEHCRFPACSVQTGKCDNQEPGDPSIMACIAAHGWKP